MGNQQSLADGQTMVTMTTKAPDAGVVKRQTSKAETASESSSTHNTDDSTTEVTREQGGIILSEEDGTIPDSRLSCTSSSSVSSSFGDETSSLNPYADEDDYVDNNNNNNNNNNGTECYRLFPMNQHSNRIQQQPKLLGNKQQSSSSLQRKHSYLSFSYCIEPQGDDEDDNNNGYGNGYDNNMDSTSFFMNNNNNKSNQQNNANDNEVRLARSHSTGELLEESPLSFMGCMTSPLSAKSSSLTNLVQLEAAALLRSEFDYTPEEKEMSEEPTPESDLRGLRNYWIVTTAALPWMTGTAVNPLLRAAYLSQRNRRLAAASATAEMSTRETKQPEETDIETDEPTNDYVSTVTLALPWLESADDRVSLYGSSWKDSTPDDQEAYIRTWLAESAQLPLEADKSKGGIIIQWYPARYHATLSSIFAMGDLCELVTDGGNYNHGNDDSENSTLPKKNNTICILEEPEHVNFYRAPGRLSWRDKFSHVIGIIHTNYKAYAQNHYSGLLTGPLVGAMSSLMVRAYCDKVVKLSPVLQDYAPEKEVVCNVHGIRREFLSASQQSSSASASKIYFIGKLLWAKGLDKLLELQGTYRKATGNYWPIDIYGSGPQEDEIQQAYLGKAYQSNQQQQQKDNLSSSSLTPARYWRRFRQPIPARFMGRRDHAEIGNEYKIFINPSITEVLCTTTAEAIAMGKWVIIPKHASNEFFLLFENCLQYSSKREFVSLLQHAMAHPPPNSTTPSSCSPSSSLNPINKNSIATEESISSEQQQSEPQKDDEQSQEDEEQQQHHILSWEAATERLIETASLSYKDAHRCRRLQKQDKSIQEWHYALGNGVKGDVLRKVFGGGPVAEQSQYQSSNSSSSISSSSSSSNVGALRKQ